MADGDIYHLTETDKLDLQTLLFSKSPPATARNTRPATPRDDAGGILFRNDSGEAIPAYAVMQVDDAAIEGGRPIASVIKPTGSGNLSLLNGPREIEINGFGVALREGLGLFDDADGAPSAGAVYGPTSGSWKLKNGLAGFQAMGSELAGIEDVTLFLSGGGVICIGKTDASHAKGATGTISVWTKYSGSDTGIDIEAVNPFADLEADKWVLFALVNGEYTLSAGEC